MGNGQQLCRVSKRYAKMQKYRYINQTKFKKLFVPTICYVHLHFVHVVSLYMNVTRTFTNVHVVFSVMYTNSYVLKKKVSRKQSKKVSFYMNIKRYVNQPEFGALEANLSHANKCSV